MEKALHYSIPEVKDIPLTADEQMIVELLTRKQVEIAIKLSEELPEDITELYGAFMIATGIGHVNTHYI